MSTVQRIAKNASVMPVAQAAANAVGVAAEIVGFVKNEMSKPGS